MSRFSGLTSFVLAAALVALLPGCHGSSVGVDDPGGEKVASLTLPPGPTPGALAAFQDTFYTYARANCAECHATLQTPLFAADSLSAAFTASLPYADLINPGNSELVSYAMNGHCGEASCSDSTNALGAVQAWSSQASFIAFQNTFYPYALAKCSACHGVVGIPLFAASDPSSAFQVASSLSGLGDPTSSLLVTYAGNGHCATTACQDDADALSAVQAWASQLASGD